MNTYENMRNVFIVRNNGSLFFVKTDDIGLIRTKLHFSTLICKGNQYVVKRSLDHFEKLLDPETFIRINRSTIVNINRISEVVSDSNGNYNVILTDNESLKWGRKYREKIVRKLRI